MGQRGKLPKAKPEKMGPKVVAVHQDAKRVEGHPPCPKRLGKVAQAKWRTIVEALDESGILSRTDSEVIEQYCLLFEKQQQCEAYLSANGLVFETGSGMRRQHPEVSLSLEVGKQMKGLLETMGLTPASRARVNVIETDTKVDPKWVPPDEGGS